MDKGGGVKIIKECSFLDDGYGHDWIYEYQEVKGTARRILQRRYCKKCKKNEGLS